MVFPCFRGWFWPILLIFFARHQLDTWTLALQDKRGMAWFCGCGVLRQGLNQSVCGIQECKEVIATRVSPPSDEAWQLESSEAVKVLFKKRNWSVLGPDRLVNYWWKRANALHEDITQVFVFISKQTEVYPLWFSEDKTRLIETRSFF